MLSVHALNAHTGEFTLFLSTYAFTTQSLSSFEPCPVHLNVYSFCPISFHFQFLKI